MCIFMRNDRDTKREIKMQIIIYANYKYIWNILTLYLH